MRNNSVIWQRVLAVVMALSVITMMTDVSMSQTLQTKAAPTPKNDGVTVFRGVLLGDGPVAKLFPEIWESTLLARYLQRADQAPASEVAVSKQKIVDLLRAQDPTFFDRFGTAIQSGDRIKIQQALNEAGTRLQKEIQSSATAGDIPDCCGPYTYVYLYVYAVIAVVVVAIAAVDMGTAVPGTGSSNLKSDVYVDLIAQRLASQPAK